MIEYRNFSNHTFTLVAHYRYIVRLNTTKREVTIQERVDHTEGILFLPTTTFNIETNISNSRLIFFNCINLFKSIIWTDWFNALKSYNQCKNCTNNYVNAVHNNTTRITKPFTSHLQAINNVIKFCTLCLCTTSITKKL